MYVPYKHMLSLLCVDGILHYSNTSIEPSKEKIYIYIIFLIYTTMIFCGWLYILCIYFISYYFVFLFRLIEAYAYESAHWPVQDLYA